MGAEAALTKRRYDSGTRKARAEDTRAAIFDADRSLFGRVGFHATGIPELVSTAGVTRGALYHHFEGKENLFAEVFSTVAEDLKLAAETKVAELRGDTWGQFVGGLTNYLSVLSTSAEAQRILMIDGPAVLGWARWREAQVWSIFAGTLTTLEMLINEGVIAGYCPNALALLIHTSLNEAALAIAHAQDHRNESDKMTLALTGMLNGLRATNPLNSK